MYKFERFLFFYSIVAITALFISFGVFYPRPLNLISLILLIPIVFYFWVKLTSPESVSAEKWSFRFLLVLILATSLTIFGYYLAERGLNDLQKADEATVLENKLSESENENFSLSQSLATMSAELTKLQNINSADTSTKDASVTDLILGTPIPVYLSKFTGKNGLKLIDVYDAPQTSAKKISTLDGTQTYLYIAKQGSWYSVILSSSVMGWVSASQVEEVQ